MTSFIYQVSRMESPEGPMRVSKIIYDALVFPRNGHVGFVSFVLDGGLFVGNVGVHRRLDGDGYRLVYPTKILRNGNKVDVVYPINKELGGQIHTAINEFLNLPHDKAETATGTNLSPASDQSSESQSSDGSDSS